MNYFYAAVALVVTAAAWFFFFAAPILSADQVKFYGNQCAKWISEEVSIGDKTSVADHWTKNGKHVFQILIDDESGGAKSVMLCIVDVTKGTMFKPSMFESSGWR